MTEEIKQYIVDSRNGGATLQNIVDGIQKNFGVKTSIQNVHKFYARFEKRSTKSENLSDINDVILNIVARYRFIKSCTDSIEEFKCIPSYKLHQIIKDGKHRIEEIREDLTPQILDCYSNGDEIEEIGNKVAYKFDKTMFRMKVDKEFDYNPAIEDEIELINMDNDTIEMILKKHIKGFSS